MSLRPSTSMGIALFLVAATVLVFLRVAQHEFVNLDDGTYIFANPHLEDGLTWGDAARAFTTPYFSNWHPLTTVTLYFDYAVYGLNAGGYHVTNLVFHVMATLLLFAAFRRMTGDVWPSAFVAACFAFHPLHVESVAWVSERKDVLSGFFWMLSLLAYGAYVKRPGLGRYLLLLVCFVMGLMSKPMMVTFPFVLLLLDYWPLRRYADPGEGGRFSWTAARRCVLEKTPLFALTAASCIVTFVAQRQAGAMPVFFLSRRA